MTEAKYECRHTKNSLVYRIKSETLHRNTQRAKKLFLCLNKINVPVNDHVSIMCYLLTMEFKENYENTVI